MDSRAFLGIEPAGDGWQMTVREGLTTRGGFLFGGCGLGAAICALESATGRECVWASAQYLSYANPGEELTIDVTAYVTGHQVSQARAACRVGDRTILSVTAALGHRPMDLTGQWEQMPSPVPRPDETRMRPRAPGWEGRLDGSFDHRLILGRGWEELDGTPAEGRTLMWSRVESIEHVDAAALAIMGDFVPMAIGQAFGTRTSGNSLDNTLRICKLVPTEWVLLDIRVHAVARGFGHGLVHMFAEDGTLLATASQSCIVRNWTENAASARPTDLR
jgi:acyl-CoA thioesterase-2